MNPANTDFFIYAGVSVPGDKAGALSSSIDALREKYGYHKEDVLKFNTVERASHISQETHRNIKQEVMLCAAQHDVTFFASFLLHKIAKSPEEARRKEINRICYHFDCHLRGKDDYGIVLLDTFQDQGLGSMLREKFSIGLIGLPYSKQYRLERVLGFHLASIGSSHFTSLSDIAIGGLRFAVNARHDPLKKNVISEILGQISPLCIRNPYNGNVGELSLFFSPREVRLKAYRGKYLELQRFFAEHGMTCDQRYTE